MECIYSNFCTICLRKGCLYKNKSEDCPFFLLAKAKYIETRNKIENTPKK